MKLKSLVAAIAVPIMLVSAAQATVVTYNFEATRRGTGSATAIGPATAFAQSQTNVTGSFSYDTSAAPFNETDDFAQYNTGQITLNNINGGPDFSSLTNPLTNVVNNEQSINSLNIRGFNGLDLFTIDLAGDSSLFSSGELPMSLALADFGVFAIFTVRDSNTFASFDITSLTEVSPVPLPAAAPLFLAGLAGVGFARRRFKKQAA